MDEQRLKDAGTEPAHHLYPRQENEPRASGDHLSDLRQDKEKVPEDKVIWLRCFFGSLCTLHRSVRHSVELG